MWPSLCLWPYFARIEKTGKFGCPNCYVHFAKQVQEQVFPYHGASEHLGKKPKKLTEARLMANPIEIIKVLKLRLARAIEVEDYEKAGELKKLLQ